MAQPKLRFLVLVKYNAEGWKELLRNPNGRDRFAAVQPVVARFGGIITRKDLVYQGDPDVVADIEFPDAEAAAAFYMAVMAGGAVSWMKLMRLATMQQGMNVMQKAADSNYAFFATGDPASGAAPAPGSKPAGRRRR